MKIIILSLIFLTTSCVVQNVGGKYEWFIEANQKVWDFSTPGDFTYNSTEIEISNNQASIQVNYSTIDAFTDGVYNTTWTERTINGTGATYSETGGKLQYDCQSGIIGVELTTPQVLTDHTVYVETTPTVFDIAAKPISIIGRFSDTSNFYIALTNNTNHYIYVMSGGFMFALANVPTTISQTVNTTYAQKFKLQGTTLSYKIWELGTTEPGWLVTATDATIASGSFALPCYSGNGRWDNARNYEVAANTDYDTTNPTFQFPNYTINEVLSRYESIEIESTVATNDAIKFDVSTDGGSTYLTYSGGSWVTNGSGYAGAMTVSEINQNLRSLSTSSKTIRFRAYMHSNNGTSTPVFQKLTLNYSIQM